MTDERVRTTRAEWKLRGMLLLFWLVPTTMGTLGFVLVPSRLNPTLSIGGLFVAQLLIWSLWSAITMLLWWVGDLLPWREGGRLRATFAYMVLGVVAVVAQIFWQSLWAVAFGIGEKRGFESTLVIGLRSSGDYFVVIYCAVVVAQLAVRWYTQWQAERVAAARLGEDLAQAHLRALQAQLNPHFLFNALNSIVTLIGRDPALAQTLVVRLADLLRATLKTSETQEVPLAQELEVTRRYLDIEQVRFADRLRVTWPDGEVPSALVPAFALQPLVENALLHGIARQSVPGEVAITTRISPAASGDQLVLTVRDTGPGLRSGASPRGTGTGLANLRARLSRLYGDGAVLALHERAEGGVEAVLRLPLRPVVDPAALSGTHTSRVGSSEAPARR